MPVAGARNPLPVARRALARLPMVAGNRESIPLALRDADGACHPAQLVDDEDGRALLVELELGALAATTLEPLAEPVAAAWWEVSERVLDNGRVRAELDEHGRVARLCCDGLYVDWRRPGVEIQGEPARPRLTVLERGPVRARIRVEHPRAVVDYALRAHDDLLRVSVRPIAGEVVVDHPIAGTGYAFCEEWGACTDGLGRGGALVGARTTQGGLTRRVVQGRLALGIDAPFAYAIAVLPRPANALGLGQASLGLGVGFAAHDGQAEPPRLRVVAPSQVVVAGDAVEISLAAQIAAKTRVHLYPRRRIAAAAVRIAAGEAQVRDTPEGDGLQIDIPPSGSVTLRLPS
jgi:hypothetical protein